MNRIIQEFMGQETISQIPYSTPQMTSNSQSGCTVFGNCQLFNSAALYNYGDIPGINGSIYLPKNVCITKFYIGPCWGDGYYFSRGAYITFRRNGAQLLKLQIDPLGQAGTWVNIPATLCNQIDNSQGWGSSWGGDGGGQSQTGKQYFGYILQ